MSHMVVDVELCKKDGACVAVCPTSALLFDEEGIPRAFTEAECIECGHCMAVCATGALSHPKMQQNAFEPLTTEMPTPEQMDGLLTVRRSTRAYSEAPVNRDAVLACLESARRAPSAKNSQKLHWIVLDGKEKVSALAREVILGMDAVATQSALLDEWERGHDRMLRGAPMVIVACAPNGYAWGKEDAAIALSYFEMAAKARGLDACWAGYLIHVSSVHAPVRWMLNVPEGYTVRGAMMLGKGKFTFRSVPPRKALSVRWC